MADPLDKRRDPGLAAGVDPTAFLDTRRAGVAPADVSGAMQPMDIRQGIIETANALGMDPGVLATIISYETAGTFDPTKRGPTTQWGQHRGLIQFGEPQAREYGVDWNDPLGSQLGANGAIVRYFRKNGWQPGMSELDAYSIVNAGAPGKYNASDANNGGAPGTVADKVNNQFGAHREKAYALLGGEYTPTNGGDYGAAAPGSAGPAGSPQNALAPQPEPPSPQIAMMDPRAFMLAQPNALAFQPFETQRVNYLSGRG